MGMALALVVGGSAAASAPPASAASPPPPTVGFPGNYYPGPFPGPSVVRVPGLNDCSAFAFGMAAWNYRGPRPQWGNGNRVEAQVVVKTRNAECGRDYFIATIQEHVCGFFGCSWNDLVNTKRIYVPANADTTSPAFSHVKPSGLHNYRVELTFYQLVIGGGPSLGYKPTSKFSNSYNF